MKKIAVISSSVRNGRLSHRVALFLKSYLESEAGVEVDILDLREYDFPLFHERLSLLPDPSEAVKDYVRRFNEADGVVVVSPVYNASFPAALKNVVDLLFKEWVRKPVCVVSVTYGSTPGIATVQHLQALFLKMNARVAAPMYTVIRAGEEYSEDGTPTDYASAAKHAAAPIGEFMWLVEKTSEGE